MQNNAPDQDESHGIAEWVNRYSESIGYGSRRVIDKILPLVAL